MVKVLLINIQIYLNINKRNWNMILDLSSMMSLKKSTNTQTGAETAAVALFTAEISTLL